jgi:hypothetical protein
MVLTSILWRRQTIAFNSWKWRYIKSMGNQIDGFKNKYRVIIAESRGHRKSELKTDA